MGRYRVRAGREKFENDKRSPVQLVTRIVEGAGSLVRWPSVAWQAVHLGAGGLSLVVLWLVLARWWGPEAFGQFNYLFAYAAICGVCCDFGLDTLLTRRVARAGPWTPRGFVVAKIGVVLGFFFLFLAGGWVLGMPPTVFVLLLGVVLLSLTSFADGIVRGMDRLDIEARIGILQKLVFIGGSITGVMVWDGGGIWVAVCYLVSHAFALAATVKVALARTWLRLSEGEQKVVRVLRQAWPLWSVALLTGLAVRIDLFMLQWRADEEAVAAYAAAARLIEGVVVLGTAYMMAVFPRIAQAWRDPRRVRLLVRRSVVILTMAGLVIGGVGYVASTWLIELLFGPEYRVAGGVLRMLFPAVALVYISGLLGHALVAIGRQNAYLAALVLAVIVNAAVDYVLIPVLGAHGAVAGFWAREVILVCILMGLVLRTR